MAFKNINRSLTFADLALKDSMDKTDACPDSWILPPLIAGFYSCDNYPNTGGE